MLKQECVSNILLVGNGILRAYDEESCDDYINKLCEKNKISYSKDELKKLSFNQRVVVASRDNVDSYAKGELSNLSSITFTEEQLSFYRRIIELKIDAILTTNYSFELENSIYKDWNKNLHWKFRKYFKNKEKLTENEKKFGLYECVDLPINDSHKNIFHIHGNADAPNSIIIGHYYYGKLISQIQDYLPLFFRRCKMAEKKGYDYQPQNWVDYFMVSNIYIMGFGLDLAEMDLWWLICCKKRYYSNTKIILYEAKDKIDIQRKMMLETYGIEICDKIKVINDNYKDFYDRVLRDIVKRVS